MRHVILWGVPDDTETYVQESGRAGRDGKLSCATIVKSASDLSQSHVTQHIMIDYCINKALGCRRLLLFKDFDECKFLCNGCKCCDVCQKSCSCGQCHVNINSYRIGLIICCCCFLDGYIIMIGLFCNFVNNPVLEVLFFQLCHQIGFET